MIASLHAGLRRNLGTLIRFGIVGVLTATIYAVLIFLLAELGHMAPTLAVAIAFVVAIVFNYLAHHRWTYVSIRPHRATLPRYALLTAVIFVANVGATAWVPAWLGVSYIVVQIGFAAIAALVAFVGLLRVFRGGSETSPPPADRA